MSSPLVKNMMFNMRIPPGFQDFIKKKKKSFEHLRGQMHYLSLQKKVHVAVKRTQTPVFPQL